MSKACPYIAAPLVSNDAVWCVRGVITSGALSSVAGVRAASTCAHTGLCPAAARDSGPQTGDSNVRCFSHHNGILKNDRNKAQDVHRTIQGEGWPRGEPQGADDERSCPGIWGTPTAPFTAAGEQYTVSHPSGLSIPAAWGHYSTRPGVKRRYHLYPVSLRVCLSGGDHGLVLASGLGRRACPSGVGLSYARISLSSGHWRGCGNK
jgi:hypothetical protein